MVALRSLTDAERDEVEADIVRCEATRKRLAGKASWMEPDSFREKIGWQIEALDRAIARYHELLKEGNLNVD